MRALSDAALLEVWERGQSLVPLWRAIVMLSAGNPGASQEALLELPLGLRDDRLLSLLEATFGTRLTALASCPRCRERLEFTVASGDLRVPALRSPHSPLSLASNGFEVQFRLPNTRDLDAIGDQEDEENIRRVLLDRCVLSVRHRGGDASVGDLPLGVQAAVGEAMLAADPQSEVGLRMSCPSCGHEWEDLFDVASFLWGQIDAWAHRLVDEVHVLASAYGWPEEDVLAMSPWRRQLYLELVTT